MPVRKIYIDSRFRDVNTNSTNTNFKYSLPQLIYTEKDTVMYIDDIIIPFSTTPITKYNNKLYVTTKLLDDVDSYNSYIIELDTDLNYTGELLKDELQIKMNNVLSSTLYNNPIAVIYNVNTNTISIKSLYANFSFYILTDEDLINRKEWHGINYNNNINLLNSINEILVNTIPKTEYYTDVNEYTTKYINLYPIKNFYLRSSSLSSGDTISMKQDNDIIKKIPVNVPYNGVIINNAFIFNDYISVSKKTISALDFKLTDAYGNVVDLQGSHISFTIILSIVPGSSDN
jgi:hypothetical protein